MGELIIYRGEREGPAVFPPGGGMIQCRAGLDHANMSLYHGPRRDNRPPGTRQA